MSIIDITIGSDKNGDLSHVVAREGSDLARRLRRHGWRAVSGWRTETKTGSVWLVRFEPASDSSLDAGDTGGDGVVALGTQRGAS